MKVNGARRLPEDALELLRLVRQGRLFAVQDWIASGKPYQVSGKGFRTTPIRAAVETGFHSMLEVFLRAGLTQEEKNDLLHRAIHPPRPALTELLLDHGAEIRSIPFFQVCESHHPAIMRMFVDRGADIVTGIPLGRIMATNVRPALGLFMQLRKERKDLEANLILQASAALRAHAWHGRLGSVCILLWAGADPYMKVPDVEHDDPDEDGWDSAIEAAIWRGHDEIVEKIGIDPTRIALSDALRDAATSGNMGLVAKIIAMGADPNAPARDDGEGALHALCWRAWCNSMSIFNEPRPLVVEEELRRLYEFLRLGGIFQPSRDSMRLLRSSLTLLGSEQIVSFIRRLRREFRGDPATLLRLIDTARLRKQLGQQWTGLRDELRGTTSKARACSPSAQRQSRRNQKTHPNRR